MNVLDEMCRAYIDHGGKTKDWHKHPDHIKNQIRAKMREALRLMARRDVDPTDVLREAGT